MRDLATRTSLRHQAEHQLRLGTAPCANAASAGVDALTLLHRMASDPETASAAIKLLHELQVHQVELDLQYEQLQQSRDELSHALDQYVERYDFAPVGLVAVDRDGRLEDGNLAAATLFGCEPATLSGRRLEDLVDAAFRPGIRVLLGRLNQGFRETCEARASRGESVRKFQVVATVAPSGRYFMMVLIESADRNELSPTRKPSRRKATD
jgi:PAS domain-containing protein